MAKKPLKTGCIYRIVWNDTYAHLGWYNDDDINDLTVDTLQESVGFFVKEIKDWIIIAAHKNSHDGFKPHGNITWIPMSCIVQISSLS